MRHVQHRNSDVTMMECKSLQTAYYIQVKCKETQFPSTSPRFPVEHCSVRAMRKYTGKQGPRVSIFESVCTEQNMSSQVVGKRFWCGMRRARTLLVGPLLW